MADSPFNRITKPNNDIYLIPKSDKYKYVFIFIHGLYAKPQTYVDLFDKKDGIFSPDFKIIIPCAPVQNVDVNDGKPTTSWFNINKKHGKEIHEDSIDFNQLEASSNLIIKIIREEAKLLNNDYSKIFLCGFSQGACLSFHIGLTLDKVLGCIVCMCGIPLSVSKINENNRKNLNIFVVLGGKDGFFIEDYVKGQIKNVIGDKENMTIKVYENNAHHVYEDELNDIKNFILNK
jgi:predicted esterase